MSRARQRKELKAQLAAEAQVNADPSSVNVQSGVIKATSQQSRFHLDAIETNIKEIDLKAVCLSIGEKELLRDAHLRIKEGVVYGLVGRNGTGKSTLLQALADNLIPGLPQNLVILLVSQLDTDQSLAESAGDDKNKTVLQVLIDSDRKRVRAQKEVEVLTAVLENGSQKDLRGTTHNLLVSRAREELDEARRIAERRSGRRGHDARKDLLVAEAKLADLEKGTEYVLAIHRPSAEIDYYAKALEMQLAAMDIAPQRDTSGLTSRAEQILRGLGFTDVQLAEPYHALSGGWKSRASLAAAMFRKCHILLLDEPSNFLDLPAVLFVQKWLKELKEWGDVSVVLVSHDRELVDEAADELMLLKRSSLSYFEGNISEFERHVPERAETLKANIRTQEALDKKKLHIQKSIATATKTAKKSGDDNKLKMAKQRQTKLDTRWGVEKNAKGHRFKLNRDFGGYHLGFRDEVDFTEFSPEQHIHIVFPESEPLKRPGPIIHLEKVTFAYGAGARRNLVVSDVDFTVYPKERIALVGANGHGKTTLVNLMTNNLKPASGVVDLHPYAKIGLYSQDAVTKITATARNETALTRFLKTVRDAGKDRGVTEQEARSYLGQLGLGGRLADTVPIGQLSGGQRVRLALAEVMWEGPHCLVLDEVTTHLDSDTIEALIDALRTFDGAIVLVSHDRHAVKAIIEGMDDGLSDEDSERSNEEDAIIGKVYLVRDKKLTLLNGGVDEYVSKVQKRLAKVKITLAA
ncbi:P-loop containing nucleoside triphosphate hydrolase protein [Flagelloscypha sp. PMI_526]|nr:P-loop containing nucleoside triphosphate hydrolase protein [Flagelloscypha sp. PMI_526]